MILRVAATLILLVACGDAAPLAPWSDDWILDELDAYLEDTDFRRQAMLDSLRNHDNLYSRQRVVSYGLGARGWDALPEWTPRSVTVDAAQAEAMAAGERATLPEGTEMIWDGTRPQSMEQWVALGREVFFRYPLRSDPYVAFGVANPEVADAMGLVRDSDGSYPGAVVFRNVDGDIDVGITCALCHTTPRDGELAIGAARRGLDYGALRIAFHETTGAPVDPELVRRMRTWGPGRADITEDDGEDPVAIPDLFGLRHQSALTQAGTIVHEQPSALAIRQETQLLHANHQRARPPRELSWALAMFLYSLEAPIPTAVRDEGSVARGAALFDRMCVGCHGNPVGGGDVVHMDVVGTDPALASGAARGTNYYRPPSLQDLDRAAPYFHDGSVPTLEAVFSAERLSDDYTGSPTEAGAVPGHEYGMDWPASDTADLIEYLRSR